VGSSGYACAPAPRAIRSCAPRPRAPARRCGWRTRWGRCRRRSSWDPPGSAGARRARPGRQGKGGVGGEPATISALERERAAAGAREGAAVGEHPARVPRGGDPATVTADGAACVVDVDGEVLDDRPDPAPLLALDDIETLHERRDRAERDDV